MIRRIRPRIQPLIEAFGDVSLAHPIHEALLVGVAQDHPRSHFEEVANSDGFFQVVVGWPSDCDTSPNGDDMNLGYLFDRLRAAVRACPFSEPDAAKIQKLFDDWQAKNVES
jgi:hypothetical protein